MHLPIDLIAEPTSPTLTHFLHPDDLSREVYGVLGAPVDAIEIAALLRRLETAAAGTSPFLLSTVNVNFLVTAQSDEEFRQSLLLSDLCTADGMPIVWMSRLLGIPIKARLAGADIFEALKSTLVPSQRLKIFFFGGAEGVGEAACEKLNSESAGLTCVGSYYPGFGTIDEMSTNDIIDTINASNADFLIAALGAKRGQAWLLQNHDRVRIPARAHFGAVINLQAGAVKRAPVRLQRLGLEWLWRIKEEPQLWRRYWHDGVVLLQLLVTRVFPLVMLAAWHRARNKTHDLRINRFEDHNCVVLNISGAATAETVGDALPSFQDAAAAAKDVVLNFADTCLLDARFIGLILMLNKTLTRKKLQLKCTGAPPRIERLFRLNGFGFLLRA